VSIPSVVSLLLGSRRELPKCAYEQAHANSAAKDNDPTNRLVAIIDNYADTGGLIEYSDQGFDMVPANEAYKLWVDYFTYALTHRGSDLDAVPQARDLSADCCLAPENPS
jgi:hypothetical protein